MVGSAGGLYQDGLLVIVREYVAGQQIAPVQEPDQHGLAGGLEYPLLGDFAI
jgi:hypothetical protein